MSTHKIETIHGKAMEFTTNIDGHDIIIDAKPEFGGQNLGPSPKKLLLNALSGCTGMDVISMLNKMRAKYSNFSIEVIGELTEEHPVVYHTLTVIYKIKMEESDRPKMEKAVNYSIERYCGVSAMLSKAAKLEHEIVYL